MWNKRKGKSLPASPIFYWGFIFIIVSLAFFVSGELVTLMTWWLMISLLLPPLVWTFRTRYVALKTICGVSFITQFLTLPFFYHYRNEFAWGHVKPFGFTVIEALPILAKVSLFLFSLIIFFKFFYSATLFGRRCNKIENDFSAHEAIKVSVNKQNDFDLRSNKNTGLFALLIIMIIGVLIPLNLWSYSQGVGLTGVEPPHLPYKLSGILFYLMKYITPMLLAYLYSQTNRGWFLMLLMLTYAWILGLCSVSKGAVLIVMFAVLVLSWIDNRKIMLVVAGMGTLLGVAVAAGARAYVYIIFDGKAGGDTSEGILKLLFNTLSELDKSIWNFDYLPLIINGILNRIEGFENLVMAQFYDPYAVDGPWQFVLRMIWKGLAPYDVNLHHMQWQGNILPEGFNNGGALLSNAVIVGNSGFWWIVVSAMVTSFFLVILEKSCNRIKYKYTGFELVSTPVIFFMSYLYFANTGGDPMFIFSLLLLLFVSWMPPLFRKSKR